VAATPGTPHGANVELKLIDPSANPYLAAVSFLGSALRGIDKGFDLPAEVPKDPSKATQPPPMLQTDQQTVIKSLETSAVAAQLLTPAVIEGLVAVRRYEITTYGDRPEAETAQALRLAWSC
jgi:glutamine synthetase